ncbi:serine carboxypeptidase-like 48 isoform X2 [Magnolia sinica]|uniref:serine carboxypeptidase-like 48 isoform X2 n=1 Tax=Magnolia sinica TaxID=86752 RepID=UPI0026588B2D|nr:serine carboxypeptidase-like 48 isoform X2 [Magnolia sinica]
MKSGSSLVHLFLFFFCISVCSLSSAQTHIPLRSSKPLPSRQFAENLIRSLNLIPGIPEVESEIDPPGPRLVERKLDLEILGEIDSDVSVEELGHHAGYYRLENTHAARLFYFFFESRGSSNDPVVLWLTGGPGCSSELALFYENGPYKIADNMSLIWNDYGWDKASNLIFVDQPTGTGFSYSTDLRDIRFGEKGVSNDVYDFLQAFFKEHPSYSKNDFYITGESYAGHYIPAVAERVHRGNKEKLGLHINLKHYDIRKKCEGSLCYDFSNMDKFLNQKSVREALGVGKRKFVSCSPIVYEAMITDWMKNFEPGIPALIEDGIKVLVYAGEYDLICNWLGNFRWVNSMEWSGQKKFAVAPMEPFTVDGKEAGLLKSYGSLSFLKVHDAGHMVPMDQPKAALKMLKKWTRGNLSEDAYLSMATDM